MQNQNPPEDDHQGNLIKKARARIQERKRIKLDKILVKIKENGRLANDEIEKLLRVSHSTATRYADILEKEGRIKQVGKVGKSVFYEIK